MDRPRFRRIISSVVLTTAAACGGHDDNNASSTMPEGPPTQQPSQTETVIAKAEGTFVPGADLVVELPGYATLKVPSDAFTSARLIEVKAVVSPQTATAWADTAGIFLPTAVADHEIRVITGDAAPLTDLTLKAIAPDSFVATVPQSSEISAFVQLLQDTELDRFDSFEYLESSYASAQRELDSTLPSFSFTDARQNSLGRFTAIVKLASTPIPQPDVAQSQSVQRLAELQHQAAAPVPTRCLGKVKRPPILASPLDRQLSAQQYFHLTPETHTITGKPESHTGVDLSANGDIVKASIDGIVEIPKYQRDVSGRGCGYGVTIRSKDGPYSVTYCHLGANAIDSKPQDDTSTILVRDQVGKFVRAGTPLGHAGTSGGASGPHLHMTFRICDVPYEPLLFMTGPYVGVYQGSYESSPENGGVNGLLDLQVLVDNHIQATTPETGTGSAEANGSVFFSVQNPPGAGGSFAGFFMGTLGPPAEGTWSGTANGATSAHGSWNAMRVYKPGDALQ